MFKLNLDKDVKQSVKSLEFFNRKKIFKKIRIFIPAGGAKVAPPVSSVLGQFGINLLDFCNQFNSKTKNIDPELSLSVLIIIFFNKTFTFSVKPIMLNELCFSFKIEELIVANNCEGFILALYRLYITFLFTRRRVNKSILFDVSFSIDTINYLTQIFGYLHSFSYFRKLN